MEENNEEIEVEVTEVSLSDKEIDEWMERLRELKENKESVTINLDDENELFLSHEDFGYD